MAILEMLAPVLLSDCLLAGQTNLDVLRLTLYSIRTKNEWSESTFAVSSTILVLLTYSIVAASNVTQLTCDLLI